MAEHVMNEELDEVERLDREATQWSAVDSGLKKLTEKGPALSVVLVMVGHKGQEATDADLRLMTLARTILPRLVAAERARRAEDAAISAMLDEAGIVPRPGDTVRAMVERLIEDANQQAADIAQECADGFRHDLDVARAEIERLTKERDEAVRAEREACAKLVEAALDVYEAPELAASIRAR